jgi:hypothetical protein
MLLNLSSFGRPCVPATLHAIPVRHSLRPCCHGSDNHQERPVFKSLCCLSSARALADRQVVLGRRRAEACAYSARLAAHPKRLLYLSQ